MLPSRRNGAIAADIDLLAIHLDKAIGERRCGAFRTRLAEVILRSTGCLLPARKLIGQAVAIRACARCFVVFLDNDRLIALSVHLHAARSKLGDERPLTPLCEERSLIVTSALLLERFDRFIGHERERPCLHHHGTILAVRALQNSAKIINGVRVHAPMMAQLEQIDLADLRLKSIFVAHALSRSNQVVDVSRQESAAAVRCRDLHPIREVIRIRDLRGLIALIVIEYLYRSAAKLEHG